MKFRPIHHRDRTAMPDITSMVDVVFLLISFFLTTSSLVDLTRERLELPESMGDDSQVVQNNALVVNIDDAGTIVVEGEPLTLPALLRKIEIDAVAARAEGQEIDVLVRAHKDCPLLYVNDVAQGLVDLRVEGWRIGVRKPQGGGGDR